MWQGFVCWCSNLVQKLAAHAITKLLWLSTAMGLKRVGVGVSLARGYTIRCIDKVVATSTDRLNSYPITNPHGL